jgi:5-(carboxyamino)imidazole ribonucleotide synthase
MKAMILPPATLGMLGGGQLGRFFVTAAHEMGYKVWVLDPDRNSPAGMIAERHFCVRSYDDYAALDEFAAGCAAVTTEFENVPAGTLDYLAKFVPVRPSAAAVAVCQNRIAEKTFLRDNGFPHGPFIAVITEDDLKQRAAGCFRHPQGRPLRLRRQGPGHGQQPRRSAARLRPFQGRACVLEQR